MIFSTFTERKQLLFFKFVDDTQRERVFIFNLFGRVWQQGSAGVAAVRSDQLNSPQSFLMPHMGSGGI